MMYTYIIASLHNTQREQERGPKQNKKKITVISITMFESLIHIESGTLFPYLIAEFMENMENTENTAALMRLSNRQQSGKKHMRLQSSSVG